MVNMTHGENKIYDLDGTEKDSFPPRRGVVTGSHCTAPTGTPSCQETAAHISPLITTDRRSSSSSPQAVVYKTGEEAVDFSSGESVQSEETVAANGTGSKSIKPQ